VDLLELEMQRLMQDPRFQDCFQDLLQLLLSPSVDCPNSSWKSLGQDLDCQYPTSEDLAGAMNSYCREMVGCFVPVSIAVDDLDQDSQPQRQDLHF